MDWRSPARVDGAYDGDTIDLQLDLGFGLRHHVSMRLDGVDTPEMRGGTDATKAAAKLARDEALRFCAEAGELIYRPTVWRGKYGRPIGDLLADGASLAAWLIEHRLGVPYDGGSRAEKAAMHEANAAHLADAGRLTPYGIGAV